MTLSFSARIDGAAIRCLIGSDTPMAAPVFCFSLMAAAVVVSGGTLIRQVAGYSEVALPDLDGKRPVEVILRHAEAAFRPVNRAWLPLGAYLRHAGGCTPLPALPAGVRAEPATTAADCPGLRLVPQPRNWHPAPGTLAVPHGLHSDLPAFAQVDALAGRSGLGPFLSATGQRVVALRDTALARGGYRLQIGPDITLHHADDAGAFHAGITLLNLMTTHDRALPCGVIEDAPRFDYRGQHLDCARHFFHPATLHRLLDLMALLKLNRFHWHFADDEAFRLQVDGLPDLWQKTEFRGEGELVPGVFGGGIRAGGSYSKADVAALLAHAEGLHIQVLPEIEVPAHAFAFNKAVPGLRDSADTGTEISIQGYGENVLNPANNATWDALIGLADEVAGLFPMAMLHLGCDELPPDAWAGSPAVHALKRREGLQTPHDVQGWMMERLAGHLAGRGIRPAAWEEAAKGLQGGIGHDALLFSWTGQGPGVAAARMGHDVVMCPAQNVYLDMAHTGDPDDWGAAWAAFVGLEDTVNWHPVPPGAEDVAHRIVGVEGTFWSEFTTADAQLEPMLAPRILGVACKAWEADGATDGPRLSALAGAYGALFDRIGWARHTGH